MMRRLIPAWLIPLCCLMGPALAAQTDSDTLARVQDLKTAGQYKAAETLLRQWTQTNPRTADVIWLEAQLAWLRRQFSASDRLYREAIDARPNHLYLQLDHAETLLNMGRFSKARRSLAGLSREEQRDAQALFVQARYAYWTGNFRDAARLVDRALRADHNKSDARALAAEIRAATSLRLNLSLVHMDDDQPLRRLEPILEAGKYLHALADLGVEASAPLFNTAERSAHAQRMALTNTLRFAGSGTTLKLGAGMFALSGQGMAWIGELEARQRLPEGLSLTGGWQREPYTRNVTSLDTLVLEDRTQVTLDWQERHGFWVQAGGFRSSFGDANRVSSYWAWALSPRIGGHRWNCRTGYSFHYSDSRESRFVSDRTLEDWLDPYDPNRQISGVFAPYFTPQHMRIHQWLASFSWTASDKVAIHLNGSYGLWARAKNPYLFLDQDAGGELFIQRDFLDMRFQPFEAGGSFNYRISDQVRLKAAYLFTRNFFYENQTFLLALHLLPGYRN
jgi:tetratricopeptide (TPR) repeat protein